MEIGKSIKILFAEDNQYDLELSLRELTQSGIEFTYENVLTPEKFIESLHNFKPDLIISDLRMPFFDGIQTLQFSLLHDSDIPFIMLTGSSDERTAVDCMKAGATDYILKDRINMLPFAVNEAIQRKKMNDEKNIISNSLLEEEKKFRLLFETMIQGVIFYSPKGEILSINPAAERILGYDADKLKGLRINEFRWKTIDEDGADLPDDHHPAILAYKGKRRVSNVIMGIIKPNKNEIIWLDVSAIPQFDSKSNFPYQVYTTFEDITDKMKRQMELKESELQYRSLFSAMNDGFSLHEIIVNEYNKPYDFKFLTINPAFEKLMGLKSIDIIGKNANEIFPLLETEFIYKLGMVAIGGNPLQMEKLFPDVKKYFQIKVFSPKLNQFAIIYQEIIAK